MSKTDDMLNQVPSFWSGLREYRAVIQAEAPEVEKLTFKIDDLLDQSFASTATWRMRDWEDEVGVVSSEMDELEVRRAKVLAKLSSNPPLTYGQLQSIVNQFLGNKNAEVYRVKGEDAVNVIMPLKNLKWNRFKGVKSTVDELIPSHVEVVFFVKDGENVYPVKIESGKIKLVPVIKYHMDVGLGLTLRKTVSIKARGKSGYSTPLFASEIRCGDLKITPSLSKKVPTVIEVPIINREGYSIIKTIKTHNAQLGVDAEADSVIGVRYSAGLTDLSVCGDAHVKRGGG